MGLALSRRLCRLLGGDISVTSTQGTGSTFTITLPTRVGETAAGYRGSQRDQFTADGEPAATVLVIDDDLAARDLLTRTLRREGLRVLTAASGAEGLSVARTELPALITLDVIMPAMDGWAVLSALKADPETAGIPVVLVTVTEDANLGYALGAAEYLAKPVERHALLTAVERHSSQRESAHVLIIDKDPMTRQLVHEALVEAGIAATDTNDGATALAALSRRRPTLIVLDLVTLDQDGVTLLRKLRAHHNGADVPVLLLTNDDLSVADRQWLQDGAAHVLATNATSYDELCARIRQLAAVPVVTVPATHTAHPDHAAHPDHTDG